MNRLEQIRALFDRFEDIEENESWNGEAWQNTMMALVKRIEPLLAVAEAAAKRADAEGRLWVIDNSDRVFKPEWTQAMRDVAAAIDELDAALAPLLEPAND